MKKLLFALAMLVIFGGALAPSASARCYYRRAHYGYYDDPYYDYGYYRPYRSYHRVYYERPYYSYYHRHDYHRPRIAVFFGF